MSKTDEEKRNHQIRAKVLNHQIGYNNNEETDDGKFQSIPLILRS